MSDAEAAVVSITWRDLGFTDVFADAEFVATGGPSHREHFVYKGAKCDGRAKYVLTVAPLKATLDYTQDRDFNLLYENLIGTTTIVFDNPRRTSVAKVLWAPEGKSPRAASVAIDVDPVPSPVPYAGPPRSGAKPKRLAQVLDRPGQVSFRALMMRVYGGKCCVTRCSIEQALEAAHIDGFFNANSDRAQNGLLLRRDLHALLDANLLAFHPSSRVARFGAAALSEPTYRSLHEKRTSLASPLAAYKKYAPDVAALRRRWSSLKR